MAAEAEQSMDGTKNNVMCQFTDPEGTPLGAPIYLPQNAGPLQLQQLINQLLRNVLLLLSSSIAVKVVLAPK